MARALDGLEFMGDPIPAISESEATGSIAEIYADIRCVYKVGVVNLIWRHLATIPVDCRGPGRQSGLFGVMAFWGAPVPSERHAVDACAAALECQRLLGLQRAEAERCGGMPLWMRVGINTGRMLVGNIGSRERLSYTVIGDPVNVASRLEPLGKIYGVDIIIGEDTRIAAGDAIIVRRLDLVSVYGRIGGLAIYELLSMAEGAGDEVPEWVGDYEAGLAAYEGRNWSEAARTLRSCRRNSRQCRSPIRNPR